MIVFLRKLEYVEIRLKYRQGNEIWCFDILFNLYYVIENS